jgi:hypothetical protein
MTIINLSGLSIGFVVSILIWAFITHELSYDDAFKDADRIFRVIRNWQESPKFSTDVPAPLAQALRSEFPAIVAVCVIELCFPSFELLIDRKIGRDFIYSPGHALPGVLIVTALGILAGIYPAIVLISANEVNDRNMWREFKTIGVFFNSKLIILQFALCIFFLIGSIFIYKQFRYIKLETDRGFTKENIVLIKNPWCLKNSNAAFKETLRAHSGITEVTGSGNVPGIDQFDVWDFLD